jgi:cell division protein FtsA
VAGDQTLPRQFLGEILEPRLEEIFSLIQNELIRSGFDDSINTGVL